MNSIWMKIAGVAVVAVVVIVVAGRFKSDKTSAPATSSESKQAEKPKTFYDMADRDKQFNEAPKPVEAPSAQPAQESAQEPAPAPLPAPAPPQAVARPPGIMYPSDLKGPTKLYFVPLSEEDDIAAQQILPYATAGRSIGRLPMVRYGLMMKSIEQIEQRWPDSWYCFRAKQMMEEITQYSDRYAPTYKITPQRLDISKFMKPRRGTEAREVGPIR
jgi:hypothetical protein